MKIQVKKEKKEKKEKPLPTIWEVPDDLWEKIEPILDEYDPFKATGRKRIDRRAALNAMIFRMRTGCQWNQLPTCFPDDSSVHRTYQKWVSLGIFSLIWALLVKEADELGGVDWEWQAADGALSKARLGGIKPARIRRIEGSQEPNGAF